MRGSDLVDAILPRLAKEGKSTKQITLAGAATRLGVGLATLVLWKRPRRQVDANSVANLIIKARRQAQKETVTQVIRPVIEFLPVEPHPSERRNGLNYELFSVLEKAGQHHKYLAPLRKLLEGKQGVYVFFDSRGRALYVGKTQKRNLWAEMNSALNRPREVQQVWRVKHPVGNRAFDPAQAARRQIVAHTVKLYELARYVSAYEVSPELIGAVESMLIRCAPNDILNVRMEKFGGGEESSLAGQKPRGGRTRGRRRA